MIIIDSLDLNKARERLLSGDVVAIPTETVYGLAASIDNERGLRKIFAMKERPFFDPLIVHVAGLRQARAVTREWPPLPDYLARVFWPGPLTIVLPKSDRVNPLITSGLDTVAIRQPRHQLTQALLEQLGVPLAAPSANKFGKTSPSRADHVAAEFPNEDLLILDGGPCEVGLESTVIAFALAPDNSPLSRPDVIRILRPGGVTEEDLQEALKKWSRPALITRVESSALSPGTLTHHYMPKIPLLIAPDIGGAELSNEQASKALGFEPKAMLELVLSDEPEFAARQLYHELRRLSESGADALFVRRHPTQSGGYWDAIWDRLSRAATATLSKIPEPLQQTTRG